MTRTVSRPPDLSSRPGEPDHTERTVGVIVAIAAGDAVPLAEVAEDLGVPLNRLLAPGVARVMCGRVWYTTVAEAARLRRILRPAAPGSLFDLETALPDAVDAVLARCRANAQRREVG